jgi:hypothetical protein
MSFWTQATLEPKRNYRFKITKSGFGDDVWWWAKNIDKPSYTISTGEYKMINHTFKYPGVLTWNNISISVVSTQEMIQGLFVDLRALEYTAPTTTTSGANTGLTKAKSKTTGLVIEQIDADGITLETWVIKGAFVTSVTHSKLDYTSDDLSETTIEIAYDIAEFT